MLKNGMEEWCPEGLYRFQICAMGKPARNRWAEETQCQRHVGIGSKSGCKERGVMKLYEGNDRDEAMAIGNEDEAHRELCFMARDQGRPISEVP